MKPDQYLVTWITRDNDQEQITSVHSLDSRSAARTVVEIEEIMNDQVDVMITVVQKL